MSSASFFTKSSKNGAILLGEVLGLLDPSFNVSSLALPTVNLDIPGIFAVVLTFPLFVSNIFLTNILALSG